MSAREDACDHEWERHDQPVPVLRVCGWKCRRCGKGTITNPEAVRDAHG